jgi:hypothetical protein
LLEISIDTLLAVLSKQMRDRIRALRAITSTVILCISGFAVGHSAAGQSAAVEIDSVRVTARVSEISHGESFLKLELPNGREAIYKVIESTPTFGRIKVGDRLRVTLLEPLAVSLEEGNNVLESNTSNAVTLAAQGKKANLIMADTEAVRCRITAANLREHLVTLQFDRGDKRVVKVNKQVDLAKIKLGGPVVVRLTRGLALDIDPR